MKRILILPFFLLSIAFAQNIDSAQAIRINQFPPADSEKYPEPDVWMDLEEEPRPLNMDQFRQAIEYPELAKDMEITGKVVVRILVDSAGNYVKHILLRSPHPLLSNAIESKLPMLKFTPAIQNNKPVNFWVTIPIQVCFLKC